MHPDSNPSKAHAIEFRGDFFMHAPLLDAPLDARLRQLSGCGDATEAELALCPEPARQRCPSELG